MFLVELILLRIYLFFYISRKTNLHKIFYAIVDKRGKNGERKKLDKEIPVSNISDENLYCLNGRVLLKKAIPFGLQHVLAMFVSNLAPVLIICSAAFIQGTNEHLTPAEITEILQCAMFAAGLGTIMQLYPV